MFLTAAIAFGASLDAVRLPVVSAPLRLGIIVAALAVGIGLTVALDRRALQPFWQIALFSTLVLLPTVALQAALSRVPFVAISRGSAGPLLWLTFAACIVLIGLCILAAVRSHEAPESGTLLFLPAALLVPAALGAPGALDEISALGILSESFLVAGVVIFAGTLAPAPWRPIAGAIALGAQFLLLWVLGRGPAIGPHAGLVAPASAAILLIMTVLLTVLAPLAALFSRRFFQTVELESGGPAPVGAPPREGLGGRPNAERTNVRRSSPRLRGR